MRILAVLFSIIFISSTNSFAQLSTQRKFELYGSINLDSGVVELCSIADSNYYPKSAHKMSTYVKNNKFHFSGQLPHPLAYQLSAQFAGGAYNSNLFVIEAGIQSMKCNVDSNHETPQVSNSIMSGYSTYTNSFKIVGVKSKELNRRKAELLVAYKDKLPDSIKLDLQKELAQLYILHDSALLNYITANPDSYLGLWQLIFLSNFGYENIFNSMYAKFSYPVRQSYAGKYLGTKIKASSVLSIGKKFPCISAVESDGKKIETSFYLKHKYTLVDFWYSHCFPCISQFSALKDIYVTYKSKGFEIIGISTDLRKSKPDWQKRIQEYSLIWPQYWDIDGKEASSLSINAFPTNYLLDSTGKILKKDLRPVELEHFLQTNLNP